MLINIDGRVTWLLFFIGDNNTRECSTMFKDDERARVSSYCAHKPCVSCCITNHIIKLRMCVCNWIETILERRLKPIQYKICTKTQLIRRKCPFQGCDARGASIKLNQLCVTSFMNIPLPWIVADVELLDLCRVLSKTASKDVDVTSNWNKTGNEKK